MENVCGIILGSIVKKGAGTWGVPDREKAGQEDPCPAQVLRSALNKSADCLKPTLLPPL